MSFASLVLAFAERFLSAQTCQLIVAPALADLEFEDRSGIGRRAANRLAVLRALAGALRMETARNSGSFAVLSLVPACYFLFLLVMCFDFFAISISTGFLAVAMLILVLSLGPAMVCFWPERQTVRSID